MTQLSGDHYVIRNDHTLKAFIAFVKASLDKHGKLVFSAPRLGNERSMSQNALLHAWIRELASFLSQRTPSAGELEGLKQELKGKFYREFGHQFSVCVISSPLSGKKKTVLKSTKEYTTGELFLLLQYIQLLSAELGLLLESKGVYKTKLDGQNG